MIKVFIPEIKRRYNKKILARGFWYSKDNKKTYYDYLNVKEYTQSIADNYYLGLFYDYLDTIKTSRNQECIFFVNGNVGNVYYSRDKIEILPGRIYKEVRKQDLRKAIKKGLMVYNGLTIYQENKRYYIEIFKTI